MLERLDRGGDVAAQLGDGVAGVGDFDRENFLGARRQGLAELAQMARALLDAGRVPGRRCGFGGGDGAMNVRRGAERTLPISSSLAGLTLSNHSPDWLSTSSPPISMRRGLSMTFILDSLPRRAPGRAPSRFGDE